MAPGRCRKAASSTRANGVGSEVANSPTITGTARASSSTPKARALALETRAPAAAATGRAKEASTTSGSVR